ncbi:DNA polymerase III subunit delta [Crocinitomix algicola]|uniref:DNA polymerase III subunit delta n=1 Tax=Crocinitomix algicola TaxID=1740263 RepID=UPI0008331FB6|nr:DNA polymerase III subunit delta [Crocinitomix algicola]
MNYPDLIKQFKKKDYKPVYFLQGEEPFYIDRIVELATTTILDESERDFNQTVVYAKDTPAIDVVDAASRLPMMSERQVVVVKEAQEYKANAWEVFESYIQSPANSTVLIFAHKYKKLDKRSRFYKLLKKNAIVFESEQVKEYNLAEWIKKYIREKNYEITDKGTALLVEFIGNDLSRIAKELEKLFILVPDGGQINEKHIEENIGISKDYNVFELVNAILEKNVLKANKIINYFARNPKAAHLIFVLSNLHTLYQRLFKAHFAGTEDPRQLASLLGMHPYPAKELLLNKRKHPAKQISRNFSLLREYDLRLKGVGDKGTDQGELLKELVYKLLH